MKLIAEIDKINTNSQRIVGHDDAKSQMNKNENVLIFYFISKHK
jgi:hypothetical protein